jgi:hypothetical protein
MLLGVGVALIALAQDPEPATPALPAEIRQYYQDHNFVVAFSTPAERRRLAPTLADRRLKTKGGVIVWLPQEDDPRLRTVAERMSRVSDRIQAVDPGILLQSEPPDLASDHLLEIRGQEVDTDAGVAVIAVDMIALAPDTQGQLIADFERASARSPIEEAKRRAVGPRMAQALHRWVRVDGVWQRESPTRVLIGSD